MNEMKGVIKRGPHSGDGLLIAVTTTASNTPLLAHMPGQKVQVKCTAGSARILFGDATTTVDIAVTSGATYGYPLATNETQEFDLKLTDTHIAADSTATGQIEIWFMGGKDR